MTAPPTYFAGARDEVAPFLPAQCRRVLEVGCGVGNFRAQLPPHDEYWGIEPHGPSATEAAGRLTRVIHGTFDDAFEQLPDGHFDLLICNDVIEHMTDHDAFLRRVRQKLAPGARLTGSVPNVRHVENLMALMFRRDWAYADDGTLDRTHLRFFTERSLRRSFAEHGCTIEAFGGINGLKRRIHPPKRAFKNLLVLLWGADTRWWQFAFRVRFDDRGSRG